MKRRLLLLGLVGIVVLGLWLWRGGLGWLAAERTLVFSLPVPAGEVRRLDLQVWNEDGLLARREEERPGGLSTEPTMSVALTGGVHRAIGTVWLDREPSPRTFQLDFDPRDDERVPLAFGRSESR